MVSKEDLAVLQQTMPTGMEGLKALEKFSRDGTAEVRKLLYDEADVLMECRYCRNMFRSAENFVAHKSVYCRGSHVAVALANQGPGGNGEREGQANVAPRRRTNSLPKRSMQNLLPIGDTQEMLALYSLPRIMKEAPTMTLEDGILKVIGSLPAYQARLEALPQDRTPVMIKQDNSSRYNEMTLRSLRSQSSGKRLSTNKPQKNEFTSAEINIIENFEKHGVRCGNFELLQCDHPVCAHLRPFHSVQALAYHSTLRHTKAVNNDFGDVRWPCLLCNRVMWSLEGVDTHVLKIHSNIKEDHVKSRIEAEKTDMGGRSTDSRRSRSRSLSLSTESKEAIKKESEALNEKEESEEEEEEEERGIRRSRSARRRGGRPSKTVPPLMKPEETRDRQSGGSEDYGEPPMLSAFGFEAEADEDDDERPLRPKKRKKSLTFKSKIDGRQKEVEKKEEEGKNKPDPNSVEGCMEDMLDKVYNVKEKKSVFKNDNTEESSRCTPIRDRRSESLIKQNKQILTRPKRTKSMAPMQKVKRQYIRKKDKEMMEQRANSEMPQPSSSNAARPSRQCKRPSWMMDGGEGDTSSQNLDQSTADESEYAETSKEEKKERKKKEKVMRVVTPVNKREKTPEQKEPNVIKMDKKHEPILFTPKAGKVVMERRQTMEANGSSSKRNLDQLADLEEEIMIVPVDDEIIGQKRSDLNKMPVFLSDHQQSIFFSGLILHNDTVTAGKSYYECKYCHVNVQNIRDGRRHMVAHLRVMRLRCALCGAGSFFCIDMRNHLQMRGCPGLNKAPKHMILPGAPCMTKEHADQLSFAAHSDNPGNAIFTSGKIVSILSSSPYLPDPEIEEKILGPTRVPPRGVPTPLKEVVEDRTAAADPAAGAAAASSSSESMPVLPIEDAAVAYRVFSGGYEQAAEIMRQQLQQPGPSAAEMGEPARRVLNFTNMAAGSESRLPATCSWQIASSTDAPLREPLSAHHRSIYRPIGYRIADPTIQPPPPPPRTN